MKRKGDLIPNSLDHILFMWEVCYECGPISICIPRIVCDRAPLREDTSIKILSKAYKVVQKLVRICSKSSVGVLSTS